MVTLKVKVVQLGKGVVVCDLDTGTTVREALSSEGIPTNGMEIRVNAESTTFDQTLEDGDVVTVVPMIKGGQLQRPPRREFAKHGMAAHQEVAR